MGFSAIDYIVLLAYLAGITAFGVMFRKSQRTVKEDRKSTRLNSSHGYISYAVFCLKKKNAHADFRSLRNPPACGVTSGHVYLAVMKYDERSIDAPDPQRDDRRSFLLTSVVLLRLS